MPALLVAIFLTTASATASQPTAAIVAPAEDARTAFERGRRLYETGTDMPGARTALDEAIRLDPSYAEAYLYRALVVQESGGVRAARADYDYAEKLRPDLKEIHRYFGEALAEAGEIDAAEAEYRAALAIDPGYTDVIYLYGKLYRDKGQLDKAIELLEQHAELEPKGTAHHVLGQIFLEKGDVARARKEFELDLATDESCYESRINLAGVLADQGDLKGAREQYERSLEFHPADYRALAGLGKAYLALGDYEMAIGTLRSALALSPDDREKQAALSRARSRLKLQYAGPRYPPRCGRGWAECRPGQGGGR